MTSCDCARNATSPDVKKGFAPLTSYIRGVPIGAKPLGAIISQLVVTNGWLELNELAFLNVPAFAHSVFLALHLPRMSESGKPPDTFFAKIAWFKKKIKDTFSNPHVLKRTLWSAFTICGYTQSYFACNLFGGKMNLTLGKLLTMEPLKQSLHSCHY